MKNNNRGSQLLDIVDDNDKIIGSEKRKIIHQKGLRHREVHVWVFNDKKEILFQKRGENKDTWPGMWDSSAGGHVEQGESYEQAAVSELVEETGIKIKFDDLIYINKTQTNSVDPHGKINKTFRTIYAYKFQGEKIVLEEEKATALRFFSIEELKNLDEQDKNDFIPILLSPDNFKLYEDIISR